MAFVKGLVGLIVALGVVFVGIPMLMFGGQAEWSAVFGSKPPAIASILTRENADRSARLTAGDRRAAIDQCVADLRKQKNPNASEARNAELRKELQDFVEGACDCVIGTLEDRLTTLQFTMAVGGYGIQVAKGLNPGVIDAGAKDNTSAVKHYAEKLGIADSIIKQSSLPALNAITDVIRKCSRRG